MGGRGVGWWRESYSNRFCWCDREFNIKCEWVIK